MKTNKCGKTDTTSNEHKKGTIRQSMKNKTTRTAMFSKVLRHHLAIMKIDSHRFAMILGMRQSGRVEKWVKGDNLPPLRRVPQIAALLGVDPIDLAHLWLGQPL